VVESQILAELLPRLAGFGEHGVGFQRRMAVGHQDLAHRLQIAGKLRDLRLGEFQLAEDEGAAAGGRKIGGGHEDFPSAIR